MHAKHGDWLIVETATVDRRARRGRIETVETTDGRPPYRVRWAGEDTVCLVYPGPDAHIVAEGDLADYERAHTHFGNNG
ncbi:MAG TPA: DUF1918 domain-containing protein [Pseudonocardiaceae bacterium]|jgi:hypothetical protein|nr:DUF1918 domain-containing protein [Pseudonocardiaceae bacterium]